MLISLSFETLIAIIATTTALGGFVAMLGIKRKRIDKLQERIGAEDFNTISSTKIKGGVNRIEHYVFERNRQGCARLRSYSSNKWLEEKFEFNPPFEQTPLILIGISNFACGDSKNPRLKCFASQITPEFVILRVGTETSSNIYEFSVNFIAFGR